MAFPGVGNVVQRLEMAFPGLGNAVRSLRMAFPGSGSANLRAEQRDLARDLEIRPRVSW
jgi:hypothetical protein